MMLYIAVSLLLAGGIVNVSSLIRPPHQVQPTAVSAPKLAPGFKSVGGQCWGEFEGFRCEILDRSQIFNHLGDYTPQPVDDFDAKQRTQFNLNVGKALEVLRRELPMVFMVSDLDFSIFAPQITVSDGNKNRIVMQKQLYAGIVKSLKLASSFSFVYPSMNVKKIEYIADCTTIQCQVDVVLPDSVRVDGQAVWEGMFYFGLDSEGLIQTHIFDRKITNLRSSPFHVASYPWLRANAPQWSEELVGARVPVPAGAWKSETTVPTNSRVQSS